jgi:ABC-type transport system involved in cytochrome c biogenesis ATPase subunit
MIELDSLLDLPIRTLSKGQRKRALLAIGLLTPQPILLPTSRSGLDLRQTPRLQTLRHAAGGARCFCRSIKSTTRARLIGSCC